MFDMSTSSEPAGLTLGSDPDLEMILLGAERKRLLTVQHHIHILSHGDLFASMKLAGTYTDYEESAKLS